MCEQEMSEYIIVKTFCNKKEIADEIINTLLKERLVAGTQISEIYSKYWWQKEIEESPEYKLEFRTKKSLFSRIEERIKAIHDYDVAEISYVEIAGASEEFKKWIDENTYKDSL